MDIGAEDIKDLCVAGSPGCQVLALYKGKCSVYVAIIRTEDGDIEKHDVTRHGKLASTLETFIYSKRFQSNKTLFVKLNRSGRIGECVCMDKPDYSHIEYGCYYLQINFSIEKDDNGKILAISRENRGVSVVYINYQGEITKC